MRKLVSLATLSYVLLSVALAQEAAKEPVRSGPPALADRFRAYREALAKRDVTTLDDIWADGYTFTNQHGDFLTKKQRLENIRSAHTQIGSVGSEDQDVRVYGDTAVITGRVTLKGKYSGKEARWTTRRGRAVRPRRRGSRAESLDRIGLPVVWCHSGSRRPGV